MNFETSESSEIIELMRSLPEDYLVSMIIDMIYKSVSFPYTNFINMIKCKNKTILFGPSNRDKIILMRAIIGYSSLYIDNYFNLLIDDNIDKLVRVYNDHNITSINYNTIPFDNLLLYKVDDNKLWHLYDINFLDKCTISVIENSYKDRTILPENILTLVKIQMFIFASVYINMDELLIYLYKYNLQDPEA